MRVQKVTENTVKEKIHQQLLHTKIRASEVHILLGEYINGSII